jgi:hypothetical protein
MCCPSKTGMHPSRTALFRLWRLFVIPRTVCPRRTFLQRGRWRSTTSSPGALCPSTMENSLLESPPVAAKKGPSQVYFPHSDVCICWSAGLTQVEDAPESTMTVGTVPLMVAAWKSLLVSIIGSSLLSSVLLDHHFLLKPSLRPKCKSDQW